MDLLHREYASPFILIDNLLICGMFSEWVDEFLKEHKEKIKWEHWLHKIHDKSWDEYNDLYISQPIEKVSKKDLETTVTDSFNILNDFTTDERG